jgi:hypothetical protein
MGTYPIPAIRRVLEGRSEISQRRIEILAELQNECQPLRRKKVSPIFLGVKQAVADLQAQGCKEGSHCQALVDSDLEENVEISIKEALNQVRNPRLVLPAPLNNQGIEIYFCGLATTTAQIPNPSEGEIRRRVSHDSDRDDRLKKVWRSLFTDPAEVSFRPYCPKP